MDISGEQWRAVRESLDRLGGEFADLVEAAPDPSAPGAGTWSVSQVAAHVLGVVHLDLALLDPSVPPPAPGVLEAMPATTVDGIGELNEAVLRSLTERDPATLAGALRSDVTELLRLTADRDPGEPIGWIGDSKMPLAGLLAHLVNEILQHGHDLARTLGRPWEMRSEDAAPFFELFIFGLAHEQVGHLLDGGGRARERPIAVEFRSDLVTPTTLVLHRGVVSARPPGPAPDVRLTFDPLVMTMMMFGRVSRPRAVLSGKVRIGGRRPWLLPLFLKTFRVPGPPAR